MRNKLIFFIAIIRFYTAKNYIYIYIYIQFFPVFQQVRFDMKSFYSERLHTNLDLCTAVKNALSRRHPSFWGALGAEK